jgi:mycothiol synthase
VDDVPIAIAEPPALDRTSQHAVRRLASEIESADGAPPLSDQALSQLGSSAVRHLVARDGDDVVGYAQLAATEVEVLADPRAIDALLGVIEATLPAFEIWAHGTRSRLIDPLHARGYRRARVLWQLCWAVTDIDAVAFPDGVRVRPFVPGQDEAAWLTVNAAAFAHHPEQGGWTIADLRAREAEPWFDAGDFLLAERGAELVGFHWMKTHAPTRGEVYVLGVAPAAQGLRLGAALLTAGLRLLRDHGVREVMLYVDESNAAAMHLYERYGFTRANHDVQYQRHIYSAS